MGMQIAFRVDASLQSGTGHVMRCLTLANALRAQGALCRFICRQQPGDLTDLLRQHEYEVLTLPALSNTAMQSKNNAPYEDWLMTSWEEDAQQTAEVLAPFSRQNWLVVDHYALDDRWERAVSACYQRLLVIDDLADRPHYADLLLDQTFGRMSADYVGLTNPECKLCCGIDYVLLRPEFDLWRPRSLERKRTGDLRRIMISLGGVDQQNFSQDVLLALCAACLPSELEVCLVLGVSSPWIEETRKFVKEIHGVELKVAVNNMAELLSHCDLVIGAAGSSAWERCCLGVPTLMLVLVDNQREIAAQLSAVGAAILLTPGPTLHNQIVYAIEKIKTKSGYLTEMSNKAAALVPGSGIRRIVLQMLETLPCQ